MDQNAPKEKKLPVDQTAVFDESTAETVVDSSVDEMRSPAPEPAATVTIDAQDYTEVVGLPDPDSQEERERQRRAKEERERREREEEEHRRKLENQAEAEQRRVMARKKKAQVGLLGIQNLDAFMAWIERIFFTALPVLVGKGEYLTAVLIAALWAGAWFLKMRLPEGPLTGAVKNASLKDVETKLIAMSKTIYRP